MANDDVPPPDLSAFLRALTLAGEVCLNCDVDSIALIESAWVKGDLVVSSYGWVVAFKSGQRLYGGFGHVAQELSGADRHRSCGGDDELGVLRTPSGLQF